MIDAVPVMWLLEQNVPLIFFLIALLTRPATWSDKAASFINNKLS